MIIPSFPFCIAILLLLSRNVLALPQPGAAHSAPVKNGDIGTYIASYRGASQALQSASDEQYRLGHEHWKKHTYSGLNAITKESSEHHDEARGHHGRIGSKLYKAKQKVDATIQGLETTRDKGHDYHGRRRHDAAEIHKKAEDALESAGKSREAMKVMDDILREKEGLGNEAVELDKKYTSASKEERHNIVQRKEELRNASHGLNGNYATASKQALDESRRLAQGYK